MTTISPKTGLELAAQIFELARHDPIELSERLLTNDTVVQVVQESLILYLKQAKAQLEQKTDGALLSPKVTALYSIDGSELEPVDVTRWFASCDDDGLRSFREEAYGDASVSESIIAFLAFFNREVEALFFLHADPEVLCQINPQEADAWIAAHRPAVLAEHDA